jgi:hypothetical protein
MVNYFEQRGLDDAGCVEVANSEEDLEGVASKTGLLEKNLFRRHRVDDGRRWGVGGNVHAKREKEEE